MDFSPPPGLYDPITKNANATLIFAVADVGGSVDPLTGNYVPTTKQVSVEALIRQSRDDTQWDAGVDQNLIAVVGWFVNPTQPPVTIRNGMSVDCTIQGYKGRLQFLSQMNNPYVANSIAADQWGVRFTGRFSREF